MSSKTLPLAAIRSGTRPVSPSEQPDRPGFRPNFSHWRPIERPLKPNPIRAVLRLCKTRPTYVRAGLTTPRTDQMFGPMPILVDCEDKRKRDGLGSNRKVKPRLGPGSQDAGQSRAPPPVRVEEVPDEDMPDSPQSAQGS